MDLTSAWWFWALLSAVFAALTAVFAKVGVKEIDSDVADDLTVNYGLRYDAFSAYVAENQLSPRVNAVWTPLDGTTVHAGFARYFSPPPVELIASQPGISASDVAKTMKIKPNYLYRVLGDLEKEGRVKKDGRQYYPAG